MQTISKNVFFCLLIIYDFSHGPGVPRDALALCSAGPALLVAAQVRLVKPVINI
jgi:hypothetical protein